VSSAYRIASPFLIRLAGVPFDLLEKLATPNACAAARDLLGREIELDQRKSAALEFVTRRESGLTSQEFAAWRIAIRRDKIPEQKIPPPLQEYARAATAAEQARSRLENQLHQELTRARRALLQTSQRILPGYLVFGSGEVHHLIDHSGGELPPRNSRTRERERHLLLYLQRIAAKNDTFSEFGPSAWGSASQSGSALNFEPRPGIARREVFLERWTAQALAAAINSDPETFLERRPRLNPNGILIDNRFVFVDSGVAIELTPQELAILGRCDGAIPIHAFVAAGGASLSLPAAAGEPALIQLAKDTSAGELDVIRGLIDKKILIAALEVPALEPFAFQILHDDIAAWREGAARQRWLPLADSLIESAADFSGTTESSRRQQILSAARAQLSRIGAERKPGQRSLYAAVNPIAEECFRDCRFEINETLLDEVVTDTEPWIDFWRDNYAFVAFRVAAGLRMVLEKAGKNALPLPAFLRACETAKLPLTGPGLVGLAVMAFQEIKAAFRERLKPHAHLAEYELTAADCHFVRENFSYQKFDEFTFPSADLQLAAKSHHAILRGEYRWIASELHPAAATLHHCMYWSCPDHTALSRALQLSTSGKPFFHFGFFAADFTAHTTVRIFDALPKQAVFASPQRGNPRWHSVSPAQAEVFIEQDGDVALRANGQYLGSFARNWIIPLGFHPFQFGLAPHSPRLRCGRVIVQRRSWSVSSEEMGGGNFSGLSRDLVLAIERLRAAKDWPRFVYIRPTEQALRRSGAEGRDKDTKPVFIDLESYLFLEIFHRWLSKAGELEITEMLPAPDDLWWNEPDGPRTFELRTLVVPR
jgi:Lantibiotic dehydratase, N terminus